MIIREKPTYSVLSNLYDVIREIYKDEKYYYKDTKNLIVIEKGSKKYEYLRKTTKHSTRT